jgi:SAM-dependent methyltransferase
MSMTPSAATIQSRATPPPDFDRLALVYCWMEWVSFGPWLGRCRCAFLDRLSHCRRALVLGDGDGRFTARLLAHNPAILVDAVDASPAMLSELARRAGQHRSRVQIQVADIRAWEPAAPAYDLVVTHFFLDCMAPDEVESLARRLRSHLRSDAAWVVSEFNLPANRFGQFIAEPLIALLYRAFGLLTGLTIRTLPDHGKALAQSGFILKHQQKWLGGLLVSDWWEPARTGTSLELNRNGVPIPEFLCSSQRASNSRHSPNLL